MLEMSVDKVLTNNKNETIENHQNHHLIKTD